MGLLLVLLLVLYFLVAMIVLQLLISKTVNINKILHISKITGFVGSLWALRCACLDSGVHSGANP